MPRLQHNNTAAKLIKQYENKERGYSAAAKELQRRFPGLDWVQQKRIMLAFLQGTPTLRRWVYTRLLDLWDKSFVEPVRNVWEQYYEERCSWVIIRHFPWEYVKEQLHSLLFFDGNYKFVYKRFPEQLQAECGSIVEAGSDGEVSVNAEGASDFWRAVRICCSVTFPTNDDGLPVVNPSMVMKRRLQRSMGAPSPRDITEIDNTFYPVFESGDMVLLSVLNDWCDKVREAVSRDNDFRSYHISITDPTNYNRVVYLILLKYMKLMLGEPQTDDYMTYYQPNEPSSGYSVGQLEQLIGHFLYGDELVLDKREKVDVCGVTFTSDHLIPPDLPTKMTLPTGMRMLDRELRGGLLKGTLNIVAGRPMMGTTAMAYSVIRNVAIKGGIPSALYTTERNVEMAKDRMRFVEFGFDEDDDISMDGIPDAIKSLESIGFQRKLTYREREQRLLSAPLWIEHGAAGVGINEVVGFIERQVRENHVQFVVVDRIDQLALEGGNRHDQAMSLAAVAERCGVVILACCGVSSYVDNRVMCEPRVGDALGSEDFEVYANSVMLLYRPEYYGIEEADFGHTRDVVQVFLAKNNQGPTTKNILLRFDFHVRIGDWYDSESD